MDMGLLVLQKAKPLFEIIVSRPMQVQRGRVLLLNG